MENAIKNRYEFVMLFDVENGNPNGDPDAGNMPRTDPETSLGIVTDVCLKRKIRNFVELTKEGEAGYNILIKADRALNTKFTEAYKELGLKGSGKETPADIQRQARDYICQNYFDVRTFGARSMRHCKRTCPAQLCKKYRPCFCTKYFYHKASENNRREKENWRYRNGQKEHNPICALSWRGLCFRNARSEDNRL